MNRHIGSSLRRTGAALLAAGLVACAPMTVFAATDTETTSQESVIASGLTMSTAYNGLSVQAGDTVSIDLSFTNSGAGEEVDLSASGLPDGFDGYFQGGSHTVTSAYIASGSSSDVVTYTVTVPEDAADGTYTFTLSAKGSSSTASLDVTLNVSEIDVSASTFEADSDEQEGTSGTSFTFSATLTNNSLDDGSYALSADAPTGWQVTFTDSDSKQVSSVDVEGQGSASLTIGVTPSNDVEAGEYNIPVYAKNGSESVELDLKVTITGSYSLDLATEDQTLSFDAKTNSRTAVTLNVTNSGNIDLSNITLSAPSVPTDWTVEFDTDTIDTLAAGASQTVTMYVTPSDAAISGDYVMSVEASCDETSEEVQFRVTVETQTVWGVVGVIIIVAIVACLYGVFRKFGRR